MFVCIKRKRDPMALRSQLYIQWHKFVLQITDVAAVCFHLCREYIDSLP